ncbi:MAG: universal stress protein [Sandaracinaceae bacterium]
MASHHRIVVGVDFHEGSGHAVRETARLAGALGDGTEIHAVTVVEPTWDIAQESSAMEHVPEELRRFLHRMGSHAAGDARCEIAMHVYLGDPPRAIAHLAAKVDADMIVVGTHERGTVDRRTLGSVSRWLLAHAPCPVLIARPHVHVEVGPSDDVQPPCPECARARAESGGARLWCPRHDGREIDRTYASYHDGAWSAIHPADRSPIRLF